MTLTEADRGVGASSRRPDSFDSRDLLITALVQRNTELRVLLEEQARWVHERHHKSGPADWRVCRRRECLVAQEARLG
jgi:hypothetical protein